MIINQIGSGSEDTEEITWASAPIIVAGHTEAKCSQLSIVTDEQPLHSNGLRYVSDTGRTFGGEVYKSELKMCRLSYNNFETYKTPNETSVNWATSSNPKNYYVFEGDASGIFNVTFIDQGYSTINDSGLKNVPIGRYEYVGNLIFGSWGRSSGHYHMASTYLDRSEPIEQLTGILEIREQVADPLKTVYSLTCDNYSGKTKMYSGTNADHLMMNITAMKRIE